MTRAALTEASLGSQDESDKVLLQQMHSKVAMDGMGFQR